MSDDPDTPSGFGNVTRQLCGGLRRRGHRVSILGWQAKETYEWEGCAVYPAGAEPLGKAGLFPVLLRRRPDVIVALADIWWLPYANAPHIRRQLEMTRTPWCLYFPVDGDCGDGLPPSWIELLRTVDAPVAMARYGHDIVARAGIRCDYIPHGVDTALFAPPSDRAAAKARFGLEGRFVILSDSRNQPRKMLPRLLDVFARVAAREPRAHLHLHTDPDDEFTKTAIYSYNLRGDLAALGLRDRVSLTPGMRLRKGGGIPLEQLVQYYQAADVHLLASSGEGFGLPTLQAAAAGAVPMAADYSASRELIAGHGLAARVAAWTTTQFGVRRALIDVDDAADQLIALAADPGRLADLSKKARGFALDYDWDRLIGDWDRLLRAAPARMRGAAPAGERSVALETIAPQARSAWPGVSIQVKVVERPAGALEAMLTADSRGRGGDLAIPTRPPDWRSGGLVVPRQLGFVGVAGAPDHALFRTLKSIFPILHGWTLEGGFDADVLELVELPAPQAARYLLARSILVLDLGDTLDPETLADAACLGTPCVHAGQGVAMALWPGLAGADADSALALARKLLTDPEAHRQAAGDAARAAEVLRPCDAQALGVSIRRLHAQQTSSAGS